MTKNEIIKALECCTSSGCGECPLQNLPCTEEFLMEQALLLIKSQESELERYKQALRNANKSYNDMVCNFLDGTTKGLRGV